MGLQLTRTVPDRQLPPEWCDGPAYPSVERIVEGLTNPWSISPGAARVLTRIVVAEQRSRILEFGAGMSSQLFAAALEVAGGGSLTSVEENPAWCEQAWAVVDQSLNVDAALIPASIHLRVDGRGIYYGYGQVTDIAARGPYDLVFVDAPWRGYGRDGALHAAIESVTPGGLIVLDDARRRREQRTLRRWMVNYPELTLVANEASVGRGLAILRKEPGLSRGRNAVGSFIEVWGGGIYATWRTVWEIRKRPSEEDEIDQAR